MTDADRPSTMARLWALARRAAVFEWGMWRSLYRWILRRPLVSEPGAVAFGYTGPVTPILIAFIVVSAIEIPILHLILPWPTVRVISLALGGYGLFWMIGLMASLRVHPHVVSDEGLRVRNGLSLDMTVPWEVIATVRARDRSLPPGRGNRYDRTGTHPVLQLGVANQTNVDIVFRGLTTVPLAKGDSEPVTEMRFAVDDPKALVGRAGAHLEAAKPFRR